MNTVENANPRVIIDMAAYANQRMQVRAASESTHSPLMTVGQTPGRQTRPAHRDGLVTLNNLLERAGKPKLPTRDEELAGITDIPAFLAALRMVQARSGRNPGQIAVASGIPRASVYALVKVDREHLPTKEKQVALFLEACRLPEHQINIMLMVWMRLRNTRSPRKREIAPRVPDASETTAPDEAATYETGTDNPLGTLVGQLDWDQVNGTLVNEDNDADESGTTSGRLPVQRTTDTLPLSPELQKQLVVAVRDIARTSGSNGFAESTGRGVGACLAVVIVSSLLMALLVIARIIPEQSLMLAAAPNLVAAAACSIGMLTRKVLREESTHAKQEFTGGMSTRTIRREPGGPIQPVGVFDPFGRGIAV